MTQWYPTKSSEPTKIKTNPEKYAHTLELSKLRQRRRFAIIKSDPEVYRLFRARYNFKRRKHRLEMRALETKRNRRYYDKILSNPVTRKAVIEYRQKRYQEKIAKIKANPVLHRKYLAHQKELRDRYDKAKIAARSHCYYLQIKSDPVAYRALQKKTHILYLKKRARLQADPKVWEDYLNERRIQRRVRDIFRREGELYYGR